MVTLLKLNVKAYQITKKNDYLPWSMIDHCIIIIILKSIRISKQNQKYK